jgi:hypothetical protein
MTNNTIDLRFIKINIFYLFISIYTQILFLFEYIRNSIDSIRILIINLYFNDKIYKIDYLDNNNKTQKLFNLFFNPYDLDIYILDTLNNIIYINNNGYFIIKYYKNNKDNTIIINLNLFKNKQFIIRNRKLLINNIIFDFINNEVIADNILHVGLNDKEITNNFKLFKNSLKDNNLTLIDLTYILNYNHIINLNNDTKMLITYNDLEEKKYELNDYINLNIIN